MNKNDLLVNSFSSLTFLMLIQSVLTKIPAPIQLQSICDQTVNILSTTVVDYQQVNISQCCNITLTSQKQLLINMISNSATFINRSSFFIPISKNYYYSSNNLTYSKSDILTTTTPIVLSLCKLDETFQLFISMISQSPCTKSQFMCKSNMCIDSDLVCDGIQSCNDGSDEEKCLRQQQPRIIVERMSGPVITIIIVGSVLLIFLSVFIALTFVYMQRKREQRRQFTSVLEDGEDWEYHLFENRREPVNNGETLPITVNRSPRTLLDSR